MRSRVIGGGFELKAIPDVEPRPMGYYHYSSGRAALYQILMSIKLTTFKVWLPDWLCESMIDAVRKTGLDYGFYRLGRDLRMDVEEFVKKNRPVSENDAIVLINYFGLVDVDLTIRQLKDSYVHSVIIEDDVQALFSFFDNKKHDADYRFTSLRKSIAAPDGGLVSTNRSMPSVNKINTFTPFKLQGALLKGGSQGDVSDEAYLSLFEEGERAIDDNYDSVMSDESHRILTTTNLDEVARLRKRNAKFLVAELSRLGIEPIVPIMENVPLFVPVSVNDRNILRRALSHDSIFCPVHWPLREDMMDLRMGSYMAEYELSLVVDQRYSLEDMQSMMDVIEQWICK